MQMATEIYPPNLPAGTNADWKQLNAQVQTPNYGQRPIAIVRGEGSRFWDADGKEYLDFLTGLSVNNLGHCHPSITKAIQEQAETLVHCSNLYYIPMQIELGRLLLDHCFADRIFFGNSGAEANEAAIKIARRWSIENRDIEAPRVISFQRSFHGRTMATLSATGQEKVHTNFAPLLDGFDFAELNDLASVEALMGDQTAAIIVEPVQAEGGVHPCTEEFLQGLRAICDRTGILLIFDEVQTGFGRCGTLFAYESYGVEPDVMTLAKSLGGGLAMGAMVTREKFATAFGFGAHASTMGGNPLTCAAGRAYIGELVEGGHLEHGKELGDYLFAQLRERLAGCENVAEIRGRGLMAGIEVRAGGPEMVGICEEQGLIINCTAGNVVRIMPALTATIEEVDRALEILIPVISEAGAS